MSEQSISLLDTISWKRYTDSRSGEDQERSKDVAGSEKRTV
jgi:hypothetical protein